ncbi:D-aminoacyl-tRNA deacylase [Platanthera zijinensis]|uniref:D-aminoacyl-tRNA deacylase n=1 Tax=Platanthera zijinensis TaxID=2320716 RepID=A0AAP0FSH0_9ASPA
MVILVVATTNDPASIGPASAFLAMPGWTPGPFLDVRELFFCFPFHGASSPTPIRQFLRLSFCSLLLFPLSQEGIASYANGEARLLKHENSIVAEDDLDRRWQEATGEPVSEVIFLSRHTAVSNRPALTVHPIGWIPPIFVLRLVVICSSAWRNCVPHLTEGDVFPQGGKPAWAAPPNPRIGPWFRLLKKIAFDHGLVPEFEVTLEATHHGPVVGAPTMFLEIGRRLDNSSASIHEQSVNDCPHQRSKNHNVPHVVSERYGYPRCRQSLAAPQHQLGISVAESMSSPYLPLENAVPSYARQQLPCTVHLRYEVSQVLPSGPLGFGR